MAAKSKTAKYYAANPEARKKRLAYQAAYNKRDDQKEYRAELNKAGRDRGIYGKREAMGKDLAHTSNGLVLKDSSKNRGSKSDSAGDRRARGGKKK